MAHDDQNMLSMKLVACYLQSHLQARLTYLEQDVLPSLQAHEVFC